MDPLISVQVFTYNGLGKVTIPNLVFTKELSVSAPGFAWVCSKDITQSEKPTNSLRACLKTDIVRANKHTLVHACKGYTVLWMSKD